MDSIFILTHFHINDNCEASTDLCYAYKTIEEARKGLKKKIALYIMDFNFDDYEAEEFIKEHLRSEDCFIDENEESGHYDEINIVEVPIMA